MLTRYHWDPFGAPVFYIHGKRKRPPPEDTVPGAPLYDQDFSRFYGYQNGSENWCFTGKPREDAGDLFGARFYQYQYARWLSPDPKFISVKNVTKPQRWNLYSFVRSNPVNLIDPDGMDDEEPNPLMRWLKRITGVQPEVSSEEEAEKEEESAQSLGRNAREMEHVFYSKTMKTYAEGLEEGISYIDILGIGKMVIGAYQNDPWKMAGGAGQMLMMGMCAGPAGKIRLSEKELSSIRRIGNIIADHCKPHDPGGIEYL